ncbi:tyrosine-type recombinase/integrase [Methanobrevibacter sp.]|uniref:tyrosine-type recombinase/integrase n=1 Tax=Methanobrevibacter sp. TaxID=66852 RepID=UPI00388DF632
MSTDKKPLSESDEKLRMMLERRSLSKSAIKNYNTVFNEIHELFGVSPSDIVKTAKQEQQFFFNDETKMNDIIELEDRAVTKYQFEYYNYLKNKKLSNTTIKLKLDNFRALLREYGIELPKPIKIVIKKDRIRDADIVSWDDVEKAMSFCKGIRDKAIISFFASTGLRSSDVVKLSISDLIKACDIYFEEGEEKTINNLLSKNPNEIIPCWELIPSKTSKKSQLCVTFNTPESSMYMWQYLKDRIAKDIKNDGEGVLSIDEPLFTSPNGKRLTGDAVGKMFQRLNERLGGDKDKNETYGKFRAHSLRKLFSTTCRRNLPNVVVNSDKTSEIDIISIFTGHVPPNESNSKVYEAIESDSHDSYLRKTYTALVPYLTIKNVEVKDIKTKQYKDLEEQNKKLQEQLDAQNVFVQRELDDQARRYEKKIKLLESVNSKLSDQYDDLQNQISQIANSNNISAIQEYISDNALVNEFSLSNKIITLYRSDINNGGVIADNGYIDTLIARAYNSLPNYRTNKIRDDGENKDNSAEYLNLKKEISTMRDNFLESNNFLLSQSQLTAIEDRLSDYCDKLWWEHKFEVDNAHIEGIIQDVAINGL